MSLIYLYFYRLIIVPSSLFLFLFLSLFLKKFRQGLTLRLSREFRPPYPPNSKNSQPIWFHCSSGEFEYAKPVIEEIKQKKPQQKILVTFYSPSFISSIKKDPLVDYCYPLPWETSSAVSSFISHFQPQKILFARTDLWPELLYQSKRKGIPTCLFSRTQKKLAFGWLKKIFSPWLLNQLDTLFFTSKQDESNHRSAFPSNHIKLIVSGDTKYDRVVSREENSLPKKQLNSDKFCLVLGSVWQEDLKQIWEPAIQLFKKGKINLIVAPHEYDEKFESFIAENTKETQYYSKTDIWNCKKILIIDEFGVLFDTYRTADLSFIGGSFKKNVHSVMEPLACGSPVVVGPYNRNNREAQDFKSKFIGRDFSIVNEIKDGSELLDLILKLQTLEVTKNEIQKEIINEVKMKTGATQIVADWALS